MRTEKKDEIRENSAAVCACVYILSVHNVHRNIKERVSCLFVQFVCLPCECAQMCTCKYYVITTGRGKKIKTRELPFFLGCNRLAVYKEDFVHSFFHLQVAFFL